MFPLDVVGKDVDKVVAFDHTAYNVVLLVRVIESPGKYVALVALLDLDHPKKVRGKYVGIVDDIVNVVPSCGDGAPLPPFA